MDQWSIPEPGAARAGCTPAARCPPGGRRQVARAVTAAGFVSLMHLVVTTSPLTVTATLPGTPESVPIARRLVREALPDCPRADDLMLAVTELATDGISHSASGQGGSFTVRPRTAPGWARIEVTDDGPAAGDPSPRNGWGLAIVADVTDRASAVIQPDSCRTAWCEVSWPSPEPDGQLARLSESLTAEHGPASREHLAEVRAAWPDTDQP
jgi:hypothetical protein